MKSFEIFANSLRDAWELVVDIKYPFSAEEPEQGDPVRQAALIPFCGCVIGIILAALGVLLPSGIAGSILWAFAAVVVLEMKDSGRSTLFISRKLSDLFFKESGSQFVSSLNTALMLFRLAALFVIAYSGARGCMILLLTAVFAAESFLAVYNPVPVIDMDQRERRYIFCVPAVVAFLAIWSIPLFTFSTVLLTIAVVWYFRSRVWHGDRPVSGDEITFCAGVAEFVLLAAAMLIF